MTAYPCCECCPTDPMHPDQHEAACPTCNNPTADRLRAELRRHRDAISAVRKLHYPADNDLAQTPVCKDCHGKAGIHPCGCWAQVDREPVCGHCNQGHKGLPVAWPCPTIRALDAAGGVS